RYGLQAVAAFDSCSSETEPSAKAVAEIIDEIKAQKIPVIYYEELSDPKVARMIAEETGAKLLLLHSCHNLSKEEFEAGETYLSLMQKNAENLREGLNECL
ncbi:MAG: metal ABC transporter substrate-binding protein, partial [Oscillospiraceae bacterium]